MVETSKEAQKNYKWDKLVAQVDVLSKREYKHGKRHGGVKNDDALSLIQQNSQEVK